MPILAGTERPREDVIVRPASKGGVEDVLDLLAEAAAWLRRRGIAQWPERFPADSVRDQLDAGAAMLVERAANRLTAFAVSEMDTGPPANRRTTSRG